MAAILDDTDICVPQQATVEHEAQQWGVCYIFCIIPLQAPITVNFAVYEAVCCSI